MSKFTKLTLSAAAAVAIATGANVVDAHAKKDKEKCYGIVKKGQNDCANAAGTHSCAGHAKKNADAGEWLLVPKGLCDRIHGGSTKPKA